jgi:hypothetical protein
MNRLETCGLARVNDGARSAPYAAFRGQRVQTGRRCAQRTLWCFRLAGPAHQDSIGTPS